MSSVLLFILIISFLVIIHELGHFFAAKKVGVTVEEFGIGLPPRIFGKHFKKTLFSINLLPFGGFVKLKGEEELNEDKDSFESKTPWQRAFIIVAGVAVNFIFALIIIQFVLINRDFKSDYFPIIEGVKPSFGKIEVVNGLIAGFVDGSKLDKDQIKNGDYIYSVNQTIVTSNDQLKNIISSSTQNNANIVVKNIKDGSIVKEFNVELIQKDEKKYLGIYLGEAGRVVYEGNLRYASGILQSLNIVEQSFKSLGKLINSAVKNKDASIVSDNVSGPIGIYSVVASINKNSNSIINLEILDLIGMLSLSLAIMNILPIPAVDGGRMVFIVYEIIRKKKVNPELELSVNKYGMLFLLVLLVLITYKDISHIISK